MSHEPLPRSDDDPQSSLEQEPRVRTWKPERPRKAKTRKYLWSLIILVGVLAGSTSFLLRARSLKGTEILVDSPTPFNPAVWAWKNEEHWAVDQMVKDIVEMMFFAAKENASSITIQTVPAGSRTYEIIVNCPRFSPPYRTRLQLQDYLWNPATFAPMAQDLAGRLGVHPGSSAPHGILNLLLEPSVSELEKTQAEVSDVLTANPASPEAQEEAAMVLGVLGLYDQSGAFQDHRGILCRMAAHLAMARCFRTGDPGPEGKLAAAGLLVLAGRKAQAAEAIPALKQDPAMPAAWVDALFMLATGDWRPVEDPAKASLAEALASFKGRSSHQSADSGAKWILEGGREDLPLGYVARTTLIGNEYSLATSRRLALPSLGWDLSDLRQVARLRKGPALVSDTEVCSALGEHPGRTWNPDAGRLEVIGWGLWAQHFQAILLDDMMRTIHYYDGVFCSRRDTLAYLDTLERRFSGLEQFPVLQKRYANIRPEVYRNAILKAAFFAQKHPELLSDCSWTSLNHLVGDHPLPKALPRYQDWLEVLMPFGTTYNWSFRAWEMSEKEHLTLSEMIQFLQMDPSNLYILGDFFAVLSPEGRYTSQQVETACAAIKGFNKKQLLWWLWATYPDHAPERIPLLREIAVIAPETETDFALAIELRSQHQEKEASEVYLKAFAETENRVMAANAMTWEVLYLHRIGRSGDAERIAKECADIYSFRGLQTLALLREAQDRLPEAEACYQQIAKRYDDQYILPAFYHRCAGKDPEYQRAWDQSCGKIFPGGLRKLDLDREPVPPLHGLIMQDYNNRISQKGIARDAVIVGMDGYKVDDFRQYAMIRAFDWSDQISLAVFQGGQYQIIHTDHGRSLGVNLLAYQPSSRTKP